MTAQSSAWPSPDINAFRPVPTNDLMRVGRDSDGGYVVPAQALKDVSVLVGLGIENDWSFEADALTYGDMRLLIGVDGTTGPLAYSKRIVRGAVRSMISLVSFDFAQARSSLLGVWTYLGHLVRFVWFWSRPNRVFRYRMIGGTRQSKDVIVWDDLRSMFRTRDTIFVKMDIEGAEYDVLPQVLSSADCVVCLTIEFHDLESKWEAFVQCLQLLAQTHELVHAHGNNWAPLIKGTNVPQVVELTFLHRDFVNHDGKQEHAEMMYPNRKLDFPNNPSREDYELIFD